MTFHQGAEGVRNRILAADVCLSDLDDTDADSPARTVAFRAVGAWAHPWQYLRWLGSAGTAFLTTGRKAESAYWEEYMRQFLSERKSRLSVSSFYTAERVRNSLYPGVAELYHLLSAHKFYVSRNIGEIVLSYAGALGFDGCFQEVFDKEKFTREFVRYHPEFRRYFVKGDSEEDEQMLAVLRFFQKRGTIEDVTGCYCGAQENSLFEVTVNRDYRPLIELLRGD